MRHYRRLEHDYHYADTPHCHAQCQRGRTRSIRRLRGSEITSRKRPSVSSATALGGNIGWFNITTPRARLVVIRHALFAASFWKNPHGDNHEGRRNEHEISEFRPNRRVAPI